MALKPEDLRELSSKEIEVRIEEECTNFRREVEQARKDAEGKPYQPEPRQNINPSDLPPEERQKYFEMLKVRKQIGLEGGTNSGAPNTPTGYIA